MLSYLFEAEDARLEKNFRTTILVESQFWACEETGVGHSGTVGNISITSHITKLGWIFLGNLVVYRISFTP